MEVAAPDVIMVLAVELHGFSPLNVVLLAG